MCWTLSPGDFLRAGIIVYVGIWLYLRFKERTANNKGNVKVYKVLNYEQRSKVFKSLGWIVALLIALFGIIVFPEVYIVTQNKPGTGQNKPEIAQNEPEITETTENHYQNSISVRESFNVKRKYVPFFYKGKGCAPFNKYISNESDSTLVLYLTELFNGAYVKVSAPENFEEVPAQSFKEWNNGLYNSWFKKPFGTAYGYISKDKKNQKSSIWTLDLREFAERDCKDIRREILKHNSISFFPDTIIINGKNKIPYPKEDREITPIDKYEPPTTFHGE